MSHTAARPPPDTKTRLIIAAEKEIALQGARARVTDIVKSAGSGNTAAINYYFKSREGLLTVCRNYRERPLNLFRADLYDAMRHEFGEEAFDLAHYYFILIAPSAALIGQLLPKAYYGRFVANCKTYSFASLEERVKKPWVQTVIHCMKQIYVKLQEKLPGDVLAMRVSLYEHHIAQSLAQMEIIMMKRLKEGDTLNQVQASVPDMAAEIASHMVYLLLQEHAPSAHNLADVVAFYKTLPRPDFHY